MQKTLLTILTDPHARQKTTVQKQLNQEYSAGAPWFNAG
jgi:hypothetical protein